MLFGGSNAIYGLSAESLNYFTGVKWYNASVGGELFDSKAYKNFIKDFSAHVDRTKVKYVVYSSLFPYQIGKLAAFRSDKSERKISLGIKPNKSVLQYIKAWQRERDRNNYGDLIFDYRVNCNFAENLATHKLEPEREDIDIAVDFLVDMATFFISIFPVASIQIVLPSEYYGRFSFDDTIFEQTLRTKFYEFLPEKYLTNAMVKIIFQPPFSSIAQVCDARYHANEDGRLWRTRNLVEFIR